MVKVGGELKRSQKLFKKKKYAQVLRILEPQVFRFRESYTFYILLGYSCLFTYDFGGAFSFLKRALQIKPNDITSLLGLAVVHLKRNETSEAIRNWLNIIDMDPNNKAAKYGLSFVKKFSEKDDIIIFLESGKINNFLYGNSIDKTIFKIFFGSLLLLAITILISLNINKIEDRFKPAIRPELSSVKIDETEDYTNVNGEFRYVLTKSQIQKSFDKAVKHLNQFEDNPAIIEINRLLLSNASDYIKNKTVMLKNFIIEPTFTSNIHKINYTEMKSDFPLYDGCFIRWKGKIANLEINETDIRFNFLIGYHEEKIIEGIMPAVLNFGANLHANNNLEILGKIDSKDNNFFINVISIHKIK